MCTRTISAKHGATRINDEPDMVTHADVLVRIPKHSSALSYIYSRNELLYQRPPSDYAYRFQQNDEPLDTKRGIDATSSMLSPQAKIHLELRCHHPGVLWQGLLPMIFYSSDHSNDGERIRQRNVEAGGDDKDKGISPITRASDQPSPSSRKRRRDTKAICIPQRALEGLGIQDAIRMHQKLIVRHSWEVNTTEISNENSTYDDCMEEEVFFEQKVELPLIFSPFDSDSSKCNFDRTGTNYPLGARRRISVVVWIFPPLRSRSDIDRTPFADIVSRIQSKVAIQHGWNAWLSTLGGGYFGIKSLEKSLWLARQQRNLAIWLGDTKMARQSTLNEAYNWMYSGRFRLAGTILDQLEKEMAGRKTSQSTNEDDKLLERCSTARICLRRLKKLSKKGLGTYHQDDRQERSIRTRDEFHRFRIVPC